MFINDYQEVSGKNSLGGNEKIMFVIKATNVLQYSEYYCYIHFEAQVKFTDELKIKAVVVKIDDIELKQPKSLTGQSSYNGLLSLNAVTVSFLKIYNNFKKFMNELKTLISDLEFLDSY